MKKTEALLVVLLMVLSPTIYAGGTTDSGGARAYIISPKDGETVSSPVTVRFGLRGIGVAPAGVEREHTGHHHLLINVQQLPDMDKPIPADDQHRHFGGGQTEVTLELPPGEHKLQLLLGDHFHVPHNPPVLSEPIIIKVY
jgi:hypothetical protein